MGPSHYEVTMMANCESPDLIVMSPEFLNVFELQV